MIQGKIYWPAWRRFKPWHHAFEVNEEWGRYIRHYGGWWIFQFTWMED